MIAAARFTEALFYPRAIARTQLSQLVAGILEDPALDVVQFDDAGGTADRDLAVPFLADMDDVVVEEASLRLVAQQLETQLASADYSVTNQSDGKGMIVSLKRPSRLTRLVIDDPGPVGRVVIRTAEPQSGGGFKIGPPIFAAPDFDAPSEMFDRVLTGLASTPIAGGKLQLDFRQQPSGSAWLIQLGTGDEATDLAALPYAGHVSIVKVAAAPTNLSLVVPGPPDTVLWSYANALLPSVGAQDVVFTPVAQKQLSAALAKAADLTLPLQLRFHSDTAGKLGILARSLKAHYVVRPLGDGPVKQRLGGAWTPLVLEAPAARRPFRGDVQLSARHLGRALNDGSPLPPTVLPAAGLRVDTASWAAAPAPFAGSDPELSLVSVQVPVEATADVEAALEVRAAAAGAPGAVLGPPVVRQLGAGTRGWVEFELPQPLPLATGGEPYWISLRTTRGSLRWFAEGAGSGRVSVDEGRSWGEADPILGDVASPLVLLFHAVPEPLPAPEIELRLGSTDLGGLAAGAAPAALLDALGSTTGSGRTTTEVLAFSRAVCDLTIDDLTLSYAPAA